MVVVVATGSGTISRPFAVRWGLEDEYNTKLNWRLTFLWGRFGARLRDPAWGSSRTAAASRLRRGRDWDICVGVQKYSRALLPTYHLFPLR